MVISFLFHMLGTTTLRHHNGLYTKVFPYFFDCSGMVPHPEGEMVGRPFLHPPVKECPYIGLEVPPRIGIARGRNGACNRLAFGNDKFELALIGRAYTEHRNGAFFDFEFNAGTRAIFSMVFFQAAQYGFSFSYGNVMWPIVPYQHEVFKKIYRMEFSKATAYAQ